MAHELFDLFEIAFNENPQLRVLTDLKSSKKFSKNAHKKAVILVGLLKKINLTLSKGDPCWKAKWLNKAGIGIKPSGLKEWFSGRASVPFKALLSLKNFVSTEEFELIKSNCDYFCTKTSSPAKLPKVISPELAWLVAAILCDGHLTLNGGRASFEVSDLKLVNTFSTIFSSIFQIRMNKLNIRDRVGYNQTYVRQVNNVPSSLFFNKVFGIPLGRKSAIIVVPEIIKQSDLEVKRAFLKGVFDTDGGKRGGGLGLTSLSKMFVDDVNELLKEFGIKSSSDSWINKRYGKKCFGSRFKIDANSMFLVRQSKAAAKC